MPIHTPYRKYSLTLFIQLGFLFCLISCQTELVAPKLSASADSASHSAARQIPIIQLQKSIQYKFTYSGLSPQSVFYDILNGSGYIFTYVYPQGSATPTSIRVESGGLEKRNFQGYMYLKYNTSGQVSEITYNFYPYNIPYKWVIDYDSQGRIYFFYNETTEYKYVHYTLITYSGDNVSKIDNYSYDSKGNTTAERHYIVKAVDPGVKHPLSIADSPTRLLLMIAQDFSTGTSIWRIHPFDALTYLSGYGTNVISQVGVKRKFLIDNVVQEDGDDIVAVYKANTSGVATNFLAFSGRYHDWNDIFTYQTFSLYIPDFPNLRP
ncbi:hypothetical protein QNI19_36215 [Cytophagaceae bacterium DM2B3-1]|uniref:DUF4595 domain-containing protein n=1 Tax=Xanthocytophaga flava TaxID=3048013 RepID=A0ABT7CXG2_9BACT|nr:hypothetical protein [Xanthocytophaga flavus]MDJ1498437.1 hypothetical protein [Xanthocytophaga flavus]